jgi:hypothetical protein
MNIYNIPRDKNNSKEYQAKQITVIASKILQLNINILGVFLNLQMMKRNKTIMILESQMI